MDLPLSTTFQIFVHQAYFEGGYLECKGKVVEGEAGAGDQVRFILEMERERVDEDYAPLRLKRLTPFYMGKIVYTSRYGSENEPIPLGFGGLFRIQLQSTPSFPLAGKILAG